MAIEPPRSKQRRIQHVRPVCGREYHNSFFLFKPVKLRKNLVQSLFAFIMPTAQSGTAHPPDTVEFIDENH